MESVAISIRSTEGNDADSTPRNSSSKKDTMIAPYQELIISQKVFHRSVNCLRFAVFVGAVAGTIERPNYPIMVLPRSDSPRAHPNSFPTTEQFGFSAATYFVPICALLEVAIASLVIGRLSDIKGRKPCILLCLYGTAVGSILKYLMRKNFWAYNAANFLNGLFSASAPVALAYAGDVNETKRGFTRWYFDVGYKGRWDHCNLDANKMIIHSFVDWCSSFRNCCYPKYFHVDNYRGRRDILASRSRQREELGLLVGDDDEDDAIKTPAVLNKKHLTIIVGALADNIGSAGLNPLCLSPHAFNAYCRKFRGPRVRANCD